MKQLQVYTYVVPALGAVPILAANDNFIVLASTGPVSVRGDTFGKLPNLVAGQGLKMAPFNRLDLIDESGAPNTVTILMAPVEFVNQVFSGSVTVTQASIDALNRPELPVGNWKDTSTMVANTPLTVFAPGANVNGAIVWSMEALDSNAASFPVQTFLAKASAPATFADGEVIAQSTPGAMNSASAVSTIRREQPTRVAAGLGLYFISSLAGTAGYLRNARYTLL